jgi:hypothetical protein
VATVAVVARNENGNDDDEQRRSVKSLLNINILL